MKPFKSCPSCNLPLKKFQGGFLWQEYCSQYSDNCSIYFRQTFKSSFEDKLITGLAVFTDTFYINYYFSTDQLWPNTTHIYIRNSDVRNKSRSPLFKVKNLPFDYDKLKELDAKYSNLLPFL